MLGKAKLQSVGGKKVWACAKPQSGVTTFKLASVDVSGNQW